MKLKNLSIWNAIETQVAIGNLSEILKRKQKKSDKSLFA